MQYPLLICCHPFSPINHLLIKNHRSLNSDMHHPISGINSLIHSVSLASHFLIHLSAHLCHHHHSHHPSLLHSFTPGSKPTFSTNPSHLNTFSTLDCLHDHGTGPDLHASRFIFFSVCSVWWTKLGTRQFFAARTVSYRI